MRDLSFDKSKRFRTTYERFLVALGMTTVFAGAGGAVLNQAGAVLTLDRIDFINNRAQGDAAIVDAIANEPDDKVREEALWALAFIVQRHLPDLRTRPLFEQALTHPRANVRWIGVLGASELFEVSWDKLLVLRNDRSKKVRDGVALAIRRFGPFPSWMFEDEVPRGTPPP